MGGKWKSQSDLLRILRFVNKQICGSLQRGHLHWYFSEINTTQFSLFRSNNLQTGLFFPLVLWSVFQRADSVFLSKFALIWDQKYQKR